METEYINYIPDRRRFYSSKLFQLVLHRRMAALQMLCNVNECHKEKIFQELKT